MISLLVPRHHFTLDARSLAAFRILLGAYLLYDLYARLSLGKYDLAWYTQDPAERSFLQPYDTPHRAPLHRLWFYRGSQTFQIFVFILSGLLSLCFCLGIFQTSGTLKAALWIVQVSQVSRNMYVSDGSDSFIRHLLLWSCFLPLSQVWSLDAAYRKQQQSAPVQGQPSSSSSSYTISGLPCVALMLQIALMYWGTVFHRTLDIFSWQDLQESEWLPPQLSAVHYALSGSFATRDNVLTRFLRTTPQAAALATLGATLLEVVAPLACLLLPPRYRHWFGLQLFALHAGLFLTLNLPNWQMVGMLATVLWIPGHVWDGCSRRRPSDDDTRTTAIYKKTDGDTTTFSSVDESSSLQARNQSAGTTRIKKLISRVVQYFFFTYMIYNWLGNRGWIQKHDGGDIGEGLRLSQYWVMYSQVGHDAAISTLTGRIVVVPVENETDEKDGDDNVQPHRRHIDLYHYIRTQQLRTADPTYYIPPNMSDLYPSPRWERALNQWAQQPYKYTDRARELCKVLCTFVTEDLDAYSNGNVVKMQLTEIEVTMRNLQILPPGSDQRYADTKPQLDNTVTINVPCTSEDSS